MSRLKRRMVDAQVDDPAFAMPYSISALIFIPLIWDGASNQIVDNQGTATTLSAEKAYGQGRV